MDDNLEESGKRFIMDLNVEAPSMTYSIETESSNHLSNEIENLTSGKNSCWADDFFNQRDPFQLTARDLEGMEFNSLEDAELFYMTYAHNIGFGVRIGGSKKDQHKNLVGKNLLCNKEGVREEKWLKNENRIRDPRPITRTGCKAKMRVMLNKSTQRWVVSVFDKEHNHELVKSSQKSLIKSNRVVSRGAKTEAMAMKRAGIRPCQIMSYFADQAGGFDKLGFTRKDLANKLHAESMKSIAGGDAKAALVYFEAKATSDPGLYMKYTVDDENRLENIFWADSISRSDYAYFGDVIAFDTTYKNNGYDLPLLVFIGINNHHQTIIFAFAILSNERQETFVWVLNEFLCCMSQKKPISVVTDGDKAMHNALKIVLPEANHRLCVWHIQRNATSNLHNIEIAQGFKQCMNSWWSEDEFYCAWNNLVQTFSLEENAWIKEKYNTRCMWAQAFLTGKFFGGMKTTSRCEGCNSYLKRYIKRNGTLLEFLHSIENAISNMRRLELEADFYSRQGEPVLLSNMQPLEKHVGEVFTRNSFKRFRKELRRQDVYIRKGDILWTDDHTRVYTLTLYLRPSKETKVTYNELNETIKCSCLMFETEGIPCRHTIFVMKNEHLKYIPESCIMHRWTINARDDTMPTINSQLDNDAIERLRHSSLVSMFHKLCYLASKSKEGFEGTRNALANLTARVEEMSKARTTNYQKGEAESVQDPPKRSNQNVKKDEQKKKRNYTCSQCGMVGHNNRTCHLFSPVGSHAEIISEDSDSEYNSSDDELCENGRFWADIISHEEEANDLSTSPLNQTNSHGPSNLEANVNTDLHSEHATVGLLDPLSFSCKEVFNDAIEVLRISYKNMNPFCVPFATANMGCVMLFELAVFEGQ